MENPHQLNFFQKLKGMTPPLVSLVHNVSDILSISQDSSYRRIRGETALSIDETIKLCNHYQIPLSSFDDQSPGTGSFRYLPFDQKKKMFVRHLHSLWQNMDQLATSNFKKIVYGAIDAPIFHLLGLPAVSAFKMHFWMNTILGVDELKGHYMKKKIDDELIQLGKQIHEYYLHVPSVEIWPDDILSTTLRQIMYYWDAGNFSNPEDALEIFEELRMMVDHLEGMTETGYKFSKGDKQKKEMAPFSFYHSELLLGNNVILTFTDHWKRVFISHQTFGALVIENNGYCENTEEWLNRIISKSNLISATAENYRIKFFNKVRKQIEEKVKQIQATA